MYARSGSYYGIIGMKGHDAHVEGGDHVMPDYFSAFVVSASLLRYRHSTRLSWCVSA